jgi:TorA maturation chaperone TorD
MNLDSPEEKDLIETIEALLEARIFAYDLLRQTFITEPQHVFYTALKEESFLHSFPFSDENEDIKHGVQLATRFIESQDSNPEKDFNAIHWDYTRLFIGPDKLPAPPWESVYLSRDRLLFQKQTMQVRRIYRKFGYIPSNHPHEADDHLGLELDFMFRLASRTKEDIDQKEFNSALDLLQEQSSFLEEHLLAWVPSFVEDVLESAETLFFQGMAKILQGYLKQDRGLIDEITEATRKASVVC